MIVWAQNATSRATTLPAASGPNPDFTHCRLSSISVTRAIGASSMRAASRVMASNLSSAGVSRMPALSREASRSVSVRGSGPGIQHPSDRQRVECGRS